MSLMTVQGLQVNVIAITELLLPSNQLVDLIVIGGGPAGFMSAITAAENGVGSVVVFEATPKTLEKVRMSGGGRCNVTNACWEPDDLVLNYPRGRLPLLGSFSRFATGDAVSWFAEKGLNLLVEKDGRMFPESNSSSEVVECLRNAAKNVGVQCFTKSAVNRVDYLESNCFLVYAHGHEKIQSKRLLLATGGHPSGHKLASLFGHRIINPVPSLFSLTLKDFPLNICAGLALNNVMLKLESGGKYFTETGRLLITHRGLSGPAILRLSSFAARELNKDKYKARLVINWLSSDYDSVRKLFREFRSQATTKSLLNSKPFKKLPRKFWLEILKRANINPSIRWAEFSSLLEKNLLNTLLADIYNVSHRGPFGEEFVTAGGVSMSEVNHSTMESRLFSGLHFAGELLNIDGVTGGYNFQHCWTSGWLAGKAIANSLISDVEEK